MDNQTNLNPLNQEVFLEVIEQKIKESFSGLQKLLIATKNVLTISEVAEYTGLSKSYIYKLTSASKIPFYKPNNKLVYFKRQEIEEWLLKNRHQTKSELEPKAIDHLQGLRNKRKKKGKR